MSSLTAISSPWTASLHTNHQRQSLGPRGDCVQGVADAFELQRLGRKFNTVLDAGLFHTFDGDERPIYLASLVSVIKENPEILLLAPTARLLLAFGQT